MTLGLMMMMVMMKEDVSRLEVTKEGYYIYCMLVYLPGT